MLSGLIRCPVCGSYMISKNYRKKKPGTNEQYKTIHGYRCAGSVKNAWNVCGFHRSYNQEKVDGAVMEILKGLQNDPAFTRKVEEILGTDQTVEESEEKVRALRITLRKQEMEREKLGDRMDAMDVLRDDYDAEYDALQAKLDEVYEAIDRTEEQIHTASLRLDGMTKNRQSRQHIKELLNNVGTLYDHMSCAERREMCRLLIDRIEVFKDPRPDGRIIRSITFRIPVWFDGKALDLQKKPDQSIAYFLDCTRLEKTAAESKATYAQIRAYILEKTGMHVSTLYIAQIKRKYGLDIGKAYNKPEVNKNHVPHCPKEKEKAILEALKHFRMIDPSVEMKEGDNT